MHLHVHMIMASTNTTSSVSADAVRLSRDVARIGLYIQPAFCQEYLSKLQAAAAKRQRQQQHGRRSGAGMGSGGFTQQVLAEVLNVRMACLP